jgi:hypothetical protein
MIRIAKTIVGLSIAMVVLVGCTPQVSAVVPVEESTTESEASLEESTDSSTTTTPTDAESWCQLIVANSGLDEYLTSISGVPLPVSGALTNETSDLRLVKCNTEGDPGFAVSVIEWKSDEAATAALATERARWVTFDMLPVTIGDIEGGMSYEAVGSGTYVQYGGIASETTLVSVGSDFRGYTVPQDVFVTGIDEVVRAVLTTPLPATL